MDSQLMDSRCSVRNQYFAAILMSLNTFNYGCLAGWMSPILSLLKSEESPFGRPLTDYETSLMASLVCIGGLVGTIFFGFASDKYGRKVAVFGTTIPFLMCWLMKLYSNSVEAVLVGRFLAGAAGAGAMTTVPVYICEIASTSCRGKLTCLAVLSVNIGIIYAYILGAYLPYTYYMWSLIVIPIIYCIFCKWIPESPSFSAKNDDFKKSQKAIAWLRSVPENSKVVQQVMNELKIEKGPALNGSYEKLSWKNICFTKPFLKRLGIILTLVNIGSYIGIYAIINYSSQIFKDAGGSLSPNESSIILGCEQLAGSYISILLIEKLGRKPLLITSSGVVAMSMGMFAIFLYVKKLKYDLSSYGWIPIMALSLAIMMSSVGVGSMPYVLAAEMFSVHVRGIVMTIAILVLWINSFIVSLSYNYIVFYIGDYGIFFIFTCVAIFGVFFSIFCVPETKGKPLHETQNDLQNAEAPENNFLI